MATEGVLVAIPGITASADLSAKQYYFVKISGANTVDVCSGATDVPCGILQNTPTSGQAANVAFSGVSKVSSNEALTVGWLIGTSADGQADRKIIGTDVTEYYVGQVLTATGAAGGLATVLINCANPTLAVTGN